MKIVNRGDRVADFELPDQTGTTRTLTGLLADGPIVLFFYPAAMTPGCTKEACHFRDLAGEFAAVGASRVGISADAVDKQAKFADQQNFDYPLLSDTDGAVATQFGVKRGLLGKFMPVITSETLSLTLAPSDKWFFKASVISSSVISAMRGGPTMKTISPFKSLASSSDFNSLNLPSITSS